MAPIKPKSIPRLELMAGRILAALMDTVQKAINLEIHSTHLWLDSYTALCWIANHQEWKQFVKARINEIPSLITKNQWRHCPSEDNLVDISSRGMNATELEKVNFGGTDLNGSRNHLTNGQQISSNKQQKKVKQSDQWPCQPHRILKMNTSYKLCWIQGDIVARENFSE